MVDKNDNKYIYYLLGKRIKKIRKQHHLTQEQLADLVNYNVGTISNIENNSFQTFSIEFLYVISKRLDITMNEFFINIETEDIEDNELITN